MPYLRRFVVSFDTFDQSRANQDKAGFDVERCKADVAAMVAIKRERNPACRVGISAVVSHENLAEIPAIMRFAHEVGVDYAGFVAVENWKIPGEAGHAESARYVAEARRVVDMDATALASQAGTAQAMNVVMLGALSSQIPLSEDDLLCSLAQVVPARFLEANKRAFALGKAEVE